MITLGLNISKSCFFKKFILVFCKQLKTPMPEFIDPVLGVKMIVFAKTSQNARFQSNPYPDTPVSACLGRDCWENSRLRGSQSTYMPSVPLLVGSLKMNTTLEYSTRVVQEGDRRCKKSTLNDLAYLTPLRIPLMNPVFVCTLVGIWTPPPLSRKRNVLPPGPEPWGGGVYTRLRVRGRGSPNSDDWRESLVLYPLCGEDRKENISVLVFLNNLWGLGTAEE